MARKQRIPFGPLEDVPDDEPVTEVTAPVLSIADAILLAPDESAESLAQRLGLDVDTVQWRRDNP